MKYNEFTFKEIHNFPIFAGKDYTPETNIKLQVRGIVLNIGTFKIDEYVTYSKTDFINRFNAMSSSAFRRGIRCKYQNVFTDTSSFVNKYYSRTSGYNPILDTITLTSSTFNVPIGTELILDVYDFFAPLEGQPYINGFYKNSTSNVTYQVHNLEGSLLAISVGANIYEGMLPYVIFSESTIPINISQFVNNYNNSKPLNK